MNYTTTFINRNFRLKVNGREKENRYINKLVGVSGLLELVEIDLVNKFIDRVIANRKDSTKCCLRRGLRITLYNK
jgi:sensor histidine kinase regulating citrate/malate metabolism